MLLPLFPIFSVLYQDVGRRIGRNGNSSWLTPPMQFCPGLLYTSVHLLEYSMG